MRQFLTYGSVRGAARKGRPYRDLLLTATADSKPIVVCVRQLALVY
jgi:hypothetical protein